ncbi:hypothetical protein PV05_00380 [Exophiala xenobiotica]|uniref:Uncharacterized protein n=1 Tax=Exophiala xenobiotica TaxID=348802 RepID=A0A0D2DCW9_9EURO|nr:uncharacterized protein PV05_00380 [Exophiala xenobiotica]KIW60142.1 hypothetical protein PV05_00380 [Exophiala xenobiotica]
MTTHANSLWCLLSGLACPDVHLSGNNFQWRLLQYPEYGTLLARNWPTPSPQDVGRHLMTSRVYKIRANFNVETSHDLEKTLAPTLYRSLLLPSVSSKDPNFASSSSCLLAIRRLHPFR